MLYYLFRFLESFGVPGSGMWSYISFRSLLAFILALIISARFGTYFIHWMKSHHISETQRDVSIDPYGVKKQGVPSMGGIIIIASMLVPCLLLGRLRNIYLLLMIVTTLWLGALGFLDDYIKIFRRNKEGLNGCGKSSGQKPRHPRRNFCRYVLYQPKQPLHRLPHGSRSGYRRYRHVSRQICRLATIRLARPQRYLWLANHFYAARTLPGSRAT